MERTTFCLLFYIRRTKLNRNGEAPIMMRITVNGVRVDASVKKTILPEFWSAAKGKVLEKKRETILAEGVAERIIGLYALGNSTREISDWMEENLCQPWHRPPPLHVYHPAIRTASGGRAPFPQSVPIFPIPFVRSEIA